MILTQDIAEYETVRQWVRGLTEQWGEVPDMEQRYTTLQSFIGLVERDPDT
jgi:hypothetical protein